MVIRLTTKFHCEIYLTLPIDWVLQGLINVRFMVMSPSTMKCFPDRICSCSCISNDTRINTYDQHCLHKATQLSRSESWPGRYDHMVPFTLMTVPKLAVDPPLVAVGFITTEPTLKWVRNSGAASTSRHGRRCRDPFLHDWGSWLSNKCRSGVQSRHTGTTHRFPVWLVHLGGQELGLFFSAPSPFEENNY